METCAYKSTSVLGARTGQSPLRHIPQGWDQGNGGWRSGAVSALRPHTNSPAIPSPAPRRVLTARVSYSTSFWTELMIGAAAEGMARANAVPHNRAPGRGPGCSSLRIAPRRLREKTLQTLGTRSSQEKHLLGPKAKDTDNLLQLRCFRIPTPHLQARPAPDAAGRGWRIYHREVM